MLVFLMLSACAGGPAASEAPSTGVPGGAATATSAPSDPAEAAPTAEAGDTFSTGAGSLQVVPLRHATLALVHDGRRFLVDPWSEADLSGPPADAILLTDIHFDHLDAAAIAKVSKPETVIVGPKAVADQLPDVDVVLANGEKSVVLGVPVEAVPMYNLQRGPEPGKVFHEKGRGNGYLLDFGDLRIYLAGDTECTPEMKALTGIDVAFVPMNLPYTMPPEEAAECVRAFAPKVVYPYHYRDSDLSGFEAALAGSGVEVRLRNWYP